MILLSSCAAAPNRTAEDATAPAGNTVSAGRLPAKSQGVVVNRVSRAASRPDLSGYWVLNKEQSDDPKEQLAQAGGGADRMDRGSRPEGGGRRGGGGMGGGGFGGRGGAMEGGARQGGRAARNP